MGSLTGIRVLDISHHMAGPMATQKLGDLGADIIKIEPTGYGEWTRTRPIGSGWIGEMNTSMIALNRNKRSLTLNLKKEEGLEIFYRLVKTADVVVTNFRPSVNKRLKVDYEEVRKRNPQIIYCAITGYGEDGPYAHRPGQDLLIQALSGVTWNAGRESDPPIPLGAFVADAYTGANVVIAILAALFYRQQTGVGQKVSVSLLDSLLEMQTQELTTVLNGGRKPKRTAQLLGHPLINSPYGIHKTADGYLALAMAPFDKLASALGCEELERFTTWEDGQIYRDEIFSIVAKKLLEKTTEEWINILDTQGIWCGPVKTYDEVLQDPQVIHNHAVITLRHPKYGEVRTVADPIQMTATPVTYVSSAPELGEHNYEILIELGYASADIDRLEKSGVIQNSAPETFKI